MSDDTETKLAQFDPDLSPISQQNIKAAQQRGLKYDPVTRTYKSIAGGNPVRDRYGQPL